MLTKQLRCVQTLTNSSQPDATTRLHLREASIYIVNKHHGGEHASVSWQEDEWGVHNELLQCAWPVSGTTLFFWRCFCLPPNTRSTFLFRREKADCLLSLFLYILLFTHPSPHNLCVRLFTRWSHIDWCAEVLLQLFAANAVLENSASLLPTSCT